MGFSYSLEHARSSSCGKQTDLLAPQHVRSYFPRGWTCIPCSERWILNHWTTREVPLNTGFFYACSFFSPYFIHPQVLSCIVSSWFYDHLYTYNFKFSSPTQTLSLSPRLWSNCLYDISTRIAHTLNMAKMNSLFHPFSYTYVFLLHYILSQYLVPSSTGLY